MGVLSWLGLAKPAEPAPSPVPRRGGARFSLDVPQEMTGLPSLGAVAPRISRREALQVPAVLRARNLIAGSLATLPIRVHGPDRRVVDNVSYLVPQPDPDIPTSVVMAQLVEDLLFESVSWFHVTKFGWHGYPVEARHVPIDSVSTSGTVWPREKIVSIDEQFPYDAQVFIDGVPIPDAEIIRFDSPNPPLLLHAARAIRTCLLLDQAAALYAKDPMALSWFTPKEGADPAEEDEIQAVLDAWEEARAKRATGYVNAALDLHEAGWDPAKLQLAEARQHAVLEIARSTGLDPEDLGVSTTSRTYQNRTDRNQHLKDYTLGAYVSAIEERLSMRDVLPRGYVAQVDFGGFVRSDAKTRMETYALGLQVGAYADENEVREAEGKPTLTPAQRAARQRTPQPTPQPARQAQMASRLQVGRGSQLWDYWTKGEGLARWAGAVHKWTTLHRLLLEAGVPAHEADGLTTNIIEAVMPGYMKTHGKHSDTPAATFTDADTAQVTFDDPQVSESFSVNPEKRTISGLLMPWNQVGRSGFTSYRFARDSLQWSNVKRVKLFRDHDYSTPLGVAVSLRSDEQGLHAQFKVARGPAGDELLALAEDGIVDGLSAGVDFTGAVDWEPDPADESVRFVRRAILREGSATALPAFDNARVTSVAANRKGVTPMDPCAQCGQQHAADAACASTPTPPAAQPAQPDLAQFTAGLTDAVAAAFTQAFERLPQPQGEGRTPVPAGRVQVTREEPVYRFNGNGHSLVRDAWKHRVEGDTDARDRLLKFNRQQQDMVALAARHPEIAAQFAAGSTSNLGAAIPPGYRPDLYVTELMQGRPLTDSVSRGSLTDATPFTLPSFTSATGMSSDHSEGQNPGTGDLQIGTVTVTPGGISGVYDLTREIVDSSNPAIDAIAMQAMRESYSQQTEAKTFAKLNTATGVQSKQIGNSTTGETPENLVAGVRSALADYQFSRFAAPNRAHLSHAATSAFAGATGSDGRPLLPSVGATNASGVGNAVTQGWYVDGLPFMATWSMTGAADADADVLIYNSQDVWAWESPLLTFRFEEKNGPANIQLALFAYFAVQVLRPVGVYRIGYVGA